MSFHSIRQGLTAMKNMGMSLTRAVAAFRDTTPVHQPACTEMQGAWCAAMKINMGLSRDEELARTETIRNEAERRVVQSVIIDRHQMTLVAA